MNDEELDELFSKAKHDLPTSRELDALRARLELLPHGGSGGGTSLAPRPAAIVGALTLAGAGLVIAWLAFGGAAPGPAPSVARLAPDPRPSTTEPAPRGAAIEPPPAPPEEVSAAPEPPRTTERRRISTVGRTPHVEPLAQSEVVPPIDPPSSAPSVESEVAMLARASRALRGGDLSVARTALEAHARTYPTGVLVEERASLEVELAIRSDPSLGRAALESFRRRHPGSGHLPRLDRLAERASDEPR